VSLAGLLIGAVIGGLTVWWLGLSSATPYPASVAHVRIGVEPPKQLGGGWLFEWSRPSRTAFALTPDGKTLVFWGLGEKGHRLYRRGLADRHATGSIDDLEPRKPGSPFDGLR